MGATTYKGAGLRRTAARCIDALEDETRQATSAPTGEGLPAPPPLRRQLRPDEAMQTTMSQKILPPASKPDAGSRAAGARPGGENEAGTVERETAQPTEAPLQSNAKEDFAADISVGRQMQAAQEFYAAYYADADLAQLREAQRRAEAAKNEWENRNRGKMWNLKERGVFAVEMWMMGRLIAIQRLRIEKGDRIG